MDEIRQVLGVCPQKIATAVAMLPEKEASGIEELRLRIGQYPTYLRNDREKRLHNVRICEVDLQEVIERASGSSVYAVQDMLKSGFITIGGGHRIGLCGRGVYKDNALSALRDISSVNLRIARQIKGVADGAADFLWTHPHSALIIAPAGRGKTTLLRDLIRQLSDRFCWRICVVDERLEIGACAGANVQLHLGSFTDIMSGVKKAEAIEMLVRAMRPQWIAVDEITAQEDVEAICRAAYCGVKFIATAHAESISELNERPIYRKLLAHNAFSSIIQIDKNRNLQMEVLTND